MQSFKYWSDYDIDYDLLKTKLKSPSSDDTYEAFNEQLLRTSNFARTKYSQLQTAIGIFENASGEKQSKPNILTTAFEALEFADAFEDFVERNIKSIERLQSRDNIPESCLFLCEDCKLVLEGFDLSRNILDDQSHSFAGLESYIVQSVKNNTQDLSRSLGVFIKDHPDQVDSIVRLSVLYGSPSPLLELKRLGVCLNPDTVYLTDIVKTLKRDEANQKLSMLCSTIPILVEMGLSMSKEIGVGMLHLAARINSESLISCLHQYSTTTQWRALDHYGVSALHYLCANDSVKALGKIWSEPFEHDECFLLSMTEHCCKNGANQCLQFLLLQSTLSHNTLSPLLFLCIEYDSIACAKTLQSNGADINVRKSGNGRTPLIESVRHNRDDFVRFLLENGADPKYSDMDGWTAADHSFYRGRLELSGILLECACPRESPKLKSNYGANILLRDIVEKQSVLWATFTLEKVYDARLMDARLLVEIVLSGSNGTISPFAVFDVQVGQDFGPVKIPITISDKEVLESGGFLVVNFRRKSGLRLLGAGALRISDLREVEAPQTIRLIIVNSEKSKPVASTVWRTIPIDSLNWGAIGKKIRTTEFPSRPMVHPTNS